MTIDQAYRFVQFVYNKAQNSYIKPDDFNVLAPIMQLSLINDRIGNVKKYKTGFPVSAVGFGLNQKTREELRPLLVKPTATTVTAGLAAFPTDYLYYDTVTAGGYNVQEVQDDELAELNNSAIKPPSTRFPKMVIHSDGIHVYPNTITSINLSYLRRPVPPKWNYTIVNTEPVYSSSGSQDFETSDMTHYEICSKILQAVGLNLGKDDITQWAEMAENVGK